MYLFAFMTELAILVITRWVKSSGEDLDWFPKVQSSIHGVNQNHFNATLKIPCLLGKNIGD